MLAPKSEGPLERHEHVGVCIHKFIRYANTKTTLVGSAPSSKDVKYSTLERLRERERERERERAWSAWHLKYSNQQQQKSCNKSRPKHHNFIW